MNNDQYQFFYEERPTKARDFRRVAKKALKGFWWTAILVTLIASLLGGVAVAGASFNYNSGSTSIEDDYDSDADVSAEEQLLTSEEAEAFERAISNLDFDTAGEILSKAYPMFGFILSIIGIVFVVIFMFALAFNLFVSSPVKVGYQRFCLEVLDGNESEIRVGTLFRFFNQSYLKTVGLNLVHTLIMELTWIPMFVCMGIGGASFVSALSSMLVGPADVSDMMVMSGLLAFIGSIFLGLILSLCINLPVSYAYSMAHIIMADYPGVGAIEALRLSRQMMKGNKARLFCLDFSFIGWYLLGACACGLGGYAVTPYQYVARAAFYHEISNRRTPEDVEFPSIDPEDYIIE